MRGRAAAASLALLAACSRGPTGESGARGNPAPAAPSSSSRGGDAAWLLEGSDDERFARVAKHLRGLDVAMVETGYRYGELFWAGHDRNWDYAAYQLGKIQTAIANGVERRPRRAASARMLDTSVDRVRDAIGRRDAAGFDAAFTALTEACNACHAAERVAFIEVRPPTLRLSPVATSADAGAVP